VVLALLLLACNPEPAETAGPPAYDAGIALREDGWLRGDLHMHSDHSDGWDDVGVVIGLAEYLDDEEFLAFNPQYTTNHLDFIAITDHRMYEAHADPLYTSDELILVGGEEFGSTGHAGALGIDSFVDHDPDGGGVSLENIQDAIAETHAQGAVFSPNHPFLPHIPFPWDVRDFDAIELSNAGWALMSPELSAERLEEWEADHGQVSPMFERGAQRTGELASGQVLAWYEALLSRGVHVGVVAGSDRHAVLMPGFPTTYVQASDATEQGIVRGIADRHTFIARSPVSAQVLVEVSIGDASFGMGDEIPIAAGGDEATVTVRVARAEGGLLRLVVGEAVATDDDLATATLGEIALEQAIDSDDFSVTLSLDVTDGDWLYPIVLEELVPADFDAETAALVLDKAQGAVETEDEDFLGIGVLFADLIPDAELLTDGSKCDPEDWEADKLQCALPDDEGLGTFYLPDWVNRAINVTAEGGEITDWCMGAVGSAVRFVEE
jgi:hypothetical protein